MMGRAGCGKQGSVSDNAMAVVAYYREVQLRMHRLGYTRMGPRSGAAVVRVGEGGVLGGKLWRGKGGRVRVCVGRSPCNAHRPVARTMSHPAHISLFAVNQVQCSKHKTNNGPLLAVPSIRFSFRPYLPCNLIYM